MRDDTAVLLIGHGSGLPYNQEVTDLRADMLRELGYKVFTAYSGTGSNIGQVMSDMVSDGVREIVALPLFVSSGKQTERDIPLLLGIPEGYGTHTSKDHGILIHYEGPFGKDPLISQVLKERAVDLDYDRSTTGLLIIAHGSPSNENHDIAVLTADRLIRRGFENVFTGFLENNAPSLDYNYNRMLELGFERIIVLPLFFASGVHVDEHIPEKLGITEGSGRGIVTYKDHDVEILCAQPFGNDPQINEILRKKISRYV